MEQPGRESRPLPSSVSWQWARPPPALGGWRGDAVLRWVYCVFYDFLQFLLLPMPYPVLHMSWYVV